VIAINRRKSFDQDPPLGRKFNKVDALVIGGGMANTPACAGRWGRQAGGRSAPTALRIWKGRSRKRDHPPGRRRRLSLHGQRALARVWLDAIPVDGTILDVGPQSTA
jgi:hypothetical protein